MSDIYLQNHFVRLHSILLQGRPEFISISPAAAQFGCFLWFFVNTSVNPSSDTVIQRALFQLLGACTSH
jgi:hypothetical protein